MANLANWVPMPVQLAGDEARRMIVAEDDDELRSILASVFERDGFEVECARSGAELMALLDEAADSGRLPDIVVTDHRMPGLTGSEVAASLRERGIGVPVILITAFGRDLDEEGGAARVVFEKPFDADDLRTAVYYCLSAERSPIAGS